MADVTEVISVQDKKSTGPSNEISAPQITRFKQEMDHHRDDQKPSGAVTEVKQASDCGGNNKSSGAASEQPTQLTESQDESGSTANVDPEVKLVEAKTNGTKASQESVPNEEQQSGCHSVEATTTEGSGEGKPNRERGSHHQAKRDRKQNNKFDASSLEISNDPDAIRKQVEFYFCDSNLPMDKFLLAQVGGTANNPVKISVIHGFQRMRHFQPYEDVVAALKDSEMLEVIDNDLIKRKVPLSNEIIGKSVEEGRRLIDDKTVHRSIYAKGFGSETPTTQFEIEAFFAPYGPTNAIRLRRTYTHIFKGSVFVEFADEGAQQAFMALEVMPKWKGQDLLIKSKKEYVDEKAADIAAGRIRPGEKWEKANQGVNRNDWKKRREDDQKRGFRDDRQRDSNRGWGRGRGHQTQGQGRGGRGHGRGRGGRGPPNDRNTHNVKVPKLATSEPDPPKPSTPAVATLAATPKLVAVKLEESDQPGSVIKTESSKATTASNTNVDPTEKPIPEGPDGTARLSKATAIDTDPVSKKRAREEDGGMDGAAHKKVDHKTEP